MDQLAPTVQVAANPVASTSTEAHTLFVGKLWFWVPILPLVVLDLWSKHGVFAFLDGAYPATSFLNRGRHPGTAAPGQKVGSPGALEESSCLIAAAPHHHIAGQQGATIIAQCDVAFQRPLT